MRLAPLPLLLVFCAANALAGGSAGHVGWIDVSSDADLEDWSEMLSEACDRPAPDAAAWTTVRVANEEEFAAALASAQSQPTEILLQKDITLTQSYVIEQDVWIHGESGRPRLIGGDEDGWVDLEFHRPSPDTARNIHLSDIALENVYVRAWTYLAYNPVEDITLVDVHFLGTEPGEIAQADGYTLYEPLVQFSRVEATTDGSTQICGSVFAQHAPGNQVTFDPKMLALWRTASVEIRNNLFVGYMHGAITANGSVNTDASCTDGTSTCTIDWDYAQHNTRLIIDDNIVQRDPSSYGEDHGFYVWGAEKLSITDNSIRGFTNAASGACVKVASVRDAEIIGNSCDSSMFFYVHVYGSTPEIPQWFGAPPLFESVDIRDNEICQAYTPCTGKECSDVCGIGYSRYNLPDYAPFPQATMLGELDVTIEGNDLSGGVLRLFSAGTPDSADTVHPDELLYAGSGGYPDVRYDPTAFTILDNTGMSTNGTTNPACDFHPDVISSGNLTADGSSCP